MSEIEPSIGNLSHDERLQMTRAVMHLLESWGLRSEEMMALLDLDGKPRHFNQYRQDKPFPDSPGLLKRIEYLVKIDDALRTTYPANPGMGRRWIRQQNRKLRSRSPLAVMVEGGERGLLNVLCHLDCTVAWDMSGSRNTSCV